jgi:Glucodextranase, domain B/PASTA domain
LTRLRTAVIAIASAGALLWIAPALAQAAVTNSNITTWTSSESGTPQNSTYLISYDNRATTLTVSGDATTDDGDVDDAVDVVCYFGSGTRFGDKVLAADVPVTGGAFTTTAAMRSIAGHACRLRAIPTGGESGDDQSQFAGPQIAVSEAGLPSGVVDGNANYPYDFYVVAATLTGSAAWDSAGSCGPYTAPYDSSFGQGNFAIDCAGSLLNANMPSGATRSDVQIDGQNAYDAASAQGLSLGTGELTTFPSLAASVVQDPTDGDVSSQETESWSTCATAVRYPPTSGDCAALAPTGVQLQRDITTSDGGLMVTMTDTWSSTDGKAHSLDLLYDDYVGLHSSNLQGVQPGYEFPGQSSFSTHQAGDTVPGPGSGPGSILVRSNVNAADGDTSQAVGAITFSSPPTGFTFVSNDEFQEHQLLQVPAGGSVSLTYIYSTGYGVAGQVQALALEAQDVLEAPSVAITSPAQGTTVSTSSVNLSGVAGAGSGITALSVGGQPVPVAPGGSWNAQVALSPGSNTITALATDAAGATVQTQVTVLYTPPVSIQQQPGTTVVVCKVPRIKGMKLPAAEQALRRAHCRVGRIRHEVSKKVRKGRAVGTGPSTGRRLPAGSKVELFVSKGP